MMIVIT